MIKIHKKTSKGRGKNPCLDFICRLILINYNSMVMNDKSIPLQQFIAYLLMEYNL